MDDLSSMISGILNSPEQMEKLKSMAGSLFGENATAPPAPAKPSESPLPDISAGEIAGLMKMANLLRSNQTDSRAQLLMAIRPHLSEQRQKRVDDAVKLLRLISILPAVKDAGIL